MTSRFARTDQQRPSERTSQDRQQASSERANPCRSVEQGAPGIVPATEQKQPAVKQSATQFPSHLPGPDRTPDSDLSVTLPLLEGSSMSQCSAEQREGLLDTRPGPMGPGSPICSCLLLASAGASDAARLPRQMLVPDASAQAVAVVCQHIHAEPGVVPRLEIVFLVDQCAHARSEKTVLA